MTTKEEPTVARGVSAEGEPERAEPTKDDAELIQEGIDADEELAKSYELPAEAKAQQMTPEEYASMGPGAKEVGSTAEPGAKSASEEKVPAPSTTKTGSTSSSK